MNGATRILNEIVAAITFAFMMLFGEVDTFLQLLFLLIGADLFFHLLYSFFKPELNLPKLRQLIFVKSAYFVVIIVAQGVDIVVSPVVPIRTIAIAYLIVLEIKSLAVLCETIGVPLPTFLRTHIAEIEQEIDKGVQPNRVKKQETVLKTENINGENNS